MLKYLLRRLVVPPYSPTQLAVIISHDSIRE